MLHPELKTVSGRRDPVAALAEATSLARALPELDVVGATVIGLKKLLPGTLFGSGKLLGYQVIPDALYEMGYVNNGLMLLSPMALITVGVLIWIQRSRNRKLIEKH